MAVGPYRGAQRESGSATPYAGAGFSGDRDVTALRETAREFSGGTRGTSSPLGASSAGTSSTGASSAGTSSAGMPPMGTSNPTGATPSQARPDTPSSRGFGTGSGRNANDLP